MPAARCFDCRAIVRDAVRDDEPRICTSCHLHPGWSRDPQILAVLRRAEAAAARARPNIIPFRLERRA